MMHSFRVRAAADPQSIPRVVGQLARHWITPDRLVVERQDGELLIVLETSELPAERAELVGETLRSCVLVHDVELQPGAPSTPCSEISDI